MAAWTWLQLFRLTDQPGACSLIFEVVDQTKRLWERFHFSLEGFTSHSELATGCRSADTKKNQQGPVQPCHFVGLYAMAVSRPFFHALHNNVCPQAIPRGLDTRVPTYSNLDWLLFDDDTLYKNR